MFDSNKKISFWLILAVFLFFSPGVLADVPASPKITFIDSATKDVGVAVRGVSGAGDEILLDLKDAKDSFSYSIKTKADEMGNWSANFDQPLKSGEYYIQAAAKNSEQILSSPFISEKFNVNGAFSRIIALFSYLVAFLTISFVAGWYISKWAEKKRSNRILMSERDVGACYNVIKKDAEKALYNLNSQELNESKISETKFLLQHISENIEKINTYILKGVKAISKYNNIINKN